MDIETQVVEMAVQSRQAARKMASVSGGQKEKMLLLLAGLIEEQSGDIVAANARDVEQAKKSGLDEARVDRLRLTPAGVQAMAEACRSVAAQDDPVGEILGLKRQAN